MPTTTTPDGVELVYETKGNPEALNKVGVVVHVCVWTVWTVWIVWLCVSSCV